MGLPINRGPDFTPSQWIAAAIGFFVSVGAAHVLALTRNWAIVLIVAGFCAPPAIVGWLKVKSRRLS
jgi:hypothetical protein